MNRSKNATFKDKDRQNIESKYDEIMKISITYYLLGAPHGGLLARDEPDQSGVPIGSGGIKGYREGSLGGQPRHDFPRVAVFFPKSLTRQRPRRALVSQDKLHIRSYSCSHILMLH